MRPRSRWILVLSVTAGGLVAWGLLGGRPGTVPLVSTPRTEPAGEARPSGRDEPRTELAARRQPVVPGSGAGTVSASDGTPDTRSALAQRLDERMGSFLSPEPQVKELLDFSQELAGLARVDPASLQVERDESGAIRFARGTLLAGDLSGTFLIEEGEVVVRFSFPCGEGLWDRRDLQIVFREGEEASGCQMTVNFQPRADEPASQHVDPGEPRPSGWSVGIAPESGAVARQLGVGASGDAWQIVDEGARTLEMPWITGTSSFDAWLRLLRPVVQR